ncbi:cell division control protein 2C [Dorcoceras hygrometricum]|uniref:Cell division control protein 2C n=1 Tax=Dorcoceras hygrometricum TaxID=472368 RepID=A0A2Z7BNM4_9LAMI|nr:cell division control protein 2C [Dorcoceras hygrometricum]
MVKRLTTSPHDPLGITDSACKNQLVVVSVQYGPFNTYIPIRSTTIDKSRVARDPIIMHTSWRSNSDIASVTRHFVSGTLALSQSTEMASSALEASGLRGFPGCQSVLYETELEQFFDTALVQDGDITGAVSGKFFTISETRFAVVFKLPTEGLVDLSEMPKNLEMVDKTLNKAKGFAAQICVLLKSDPVIMMAEAVPFPSFKILSIKTVNTYVVMNETIDARGKSDEPGMAKVAIVKRKTGSEKKSESNEEATGEAPVEVVSEKFVSKKRPTVVGDEAAITKKKRTTKSKASSSKASMDMVSVAQDAVPLQIIEPAPVAIVEQPPVLKRKSKKRKLRLPKGSDEENVEERPTEEERHAYAQLETTDDVDVIIEQVIAETSQLAIDEGDQFFAETNVGEIVFGDTPVDEADDLEQWFDRSYEDFVSRDTEQLIVSTSDLDKGTGTAETVAGEQQVTMFVEKETVAESEGSKDVVVAKVLWRSVGSNQIDEELMTLDYLLMQISDDMMLPSVTAAEITKMKSDLPVEIKEVHDQDWYYASLPKISATEKGKAPLEEADTVKGNPAREMVQLICADVYFLVQLRQQVMQDVVEFFHSFSINKITDLESLRELAEKEKHMLLWAETDSLETAVKRRVYILAKYREMLLRKFLDSHRKYFTPGQPWIAMASQIIDLLSAAHDKSLDELQAQQQEHGIIMDRPSSSQFFGDSANSSGAVLAQFYSLAKCTCWVRTMVFVDGIWTLLQGNDYWRSSCRLSIFVNRKLLPERVIEENFVPHGYFIEPVQYWGAAPSIIKSWGWSRVCTDVIRYSMFGCLSPVRGINFCRDIVVHSSVFDVLEKIPNNFCSVFQQDIDANSFVGYFSDLGVQPFLQSVPDIELLSSDGSTVYRSPYSQSDTIFDQDDLMDFHANSDSDEQTSDHQFDLPVSTTNVGSTPAVAKFSLQATDIKESFAQLHASIEDIRFEKIRHKDDTDRLRDDRSYRTLLINSRKDSQDLRAVLSLDLSTYQKKLSTQVAAAAFDTVAFRKEVEELDAKVTYLDGQVAAIRNDLLDFRAKAEKNHLNLSTQFGFLVDYINRGGDAKKGESGSSQPRPPPDDQSRPSGGSGDSGSHRRSGSSMRMRSSGESPVRGIIYGPYPPGAPPKRSTKYWMTGEKDF